MNEYVSEEESDYNDAKYVFDTAWGKYLIAVADGASVEEQEKLRDEFILAEHHAHELWVCWKQNHPHREMMGGVSFSGGEIYDDTAEVCIVCGRKPKHITTTTTAIEEIPF